MEHQHSTIELVPNHYVGSYIYITIHVREKHKTDIGVICLQDYLECRLTTLITNNKLATLAEATGKE